MTGLLDVAVLHADALMNLTPWQLWDITTGAPAPGSRTVEAREVLERAMTLPGGLEHVRAADAQAGVWLVEVGGIARAGGDLVAVGEGQPHDRPPGPARGSQDRQLHRRAP